MSWGGGARKRMELQINYNILLNTTIERGNYIMINLLLFCFLTSSLAEASFASEKCFWQNK